jgi:hypothetical protein
MTQPKGRQPGKSTLIGVPPLSGEEVGRTTPARGDVRDRETCEWPLRPLPPVLPGAVGDATPRRGLSSQ